MSFIMAQDEFLSGLYETRFEPMVRYAAARLLDYHDACDVVQEVFVVAMKCIDKLMRSENPEGWLMKALTYKIMHEKRARAWFITLYNRMLADMQDTEFGYTDDYCDLGLHEILKEEEFVVLRLIYIEKHTVREAADMLGIKHEACKKRVQAAKRKLAQRI